MLVNILFIAKKLMHIIICMLRKITFIKVTHAENFYFESQIIPDFFFFDLQC